MSGVYGKSEKPGTNNSKNQNVSNNYVFGNKPSPGKRLTLTKSMHIFISELTNL